MDDAELCIAFSWLYSTNASPEVRVDRVRAVDFDARLRSNASLTLCMYDRANGLVIDVEHPDARLTGVSFVQMTGPDDALSVPGKAGVYWIATTEPILHVLNMSDHVPGIWPDKHTVVYNGTSDNLRTRAREHLGRVWVALGNFD